MTKTWLNGFLGVVGKALADVDVLLPSQDQDQAEEERGVEAEDGALQETTDSRRRRKNRR